MAGSQSKRWMKFNTSSFWLLYESPSHVSPTNIRFVAVFSRQLFEIWTDQNLRLLSNKGFFFSSFLQTKVGKKIKNDAKAEIRSFWNAVLIKIFSSQCHHPKTALKNYYQIRRKNGSGDFSVPYRILRNKRRRIWEGIYRVLQKKSHPKGNFRKKLIVFIIHNIRLRYTLTLITKVVPLTLITKVVPKLMLVLFGHTCNTIYWISDEVHVFCSALPFQRAPTDVCMPNRSWVTAGFVKTVAFTPPKKGKKPAHLFRSSDNAVHVSVMETTRNHTVWGSDCMVDASSLQCCGTQASLAQKEPYVADQFLNEKSVIEEVSVISTRYEQRVFPLPSCNTPYFSVFWESRRVDRPTLGNRRRRPTSLCLLTFVELFSSWIHHYKATPLTHILFWGRNNKSRIHQQWWCEKLDLGKFVPDFPNTLNNDAPFLLPRGKEEPTLNKYVSFQAPSLKALNWHSWDVWVICQLSNCVWWSSSITTDTVLMLTSIITVFSLLPTCSLAADSLPSVNALCRLRKVKSCKV